MVMLVDDPMPASWATRAGQYIHLCLPRHKIGRMVDAVHGQRGTMIVVVYSEYTGDGSSSRCSGHSCNVADLT